MTTLEFDPLKKSNLEVKRVALELIEGIHFNLNSEPDQHKAIHESRKLFKKLRALLRLLKFEIKRKKIFTEDAQFRDLSRKISPLRDITSLIECLTRLHEKFPTGSTSSIINECREILFTKRLELEEDANSWEQTLQIVKEILTKRQKKTSQWKLTKKLYPSWQKGLEEVYTAGRKSMSYAYKHPSGENFHEWRKNVKYLANMVSFMKNAWPPIVETWLQEISSLATILGEDHDFEMLKEQLETEHLKLGKRFHETILHEILEQEIEQLRKVAYGLGKKIFAEKGKSFSARIITYYKTSASEK
ncbi:MAG: CHAD domain-containing protein [Flammeovirgaceae bacterium]|nr:CHAD domain-containing protein [Flammeovirgaceae bacterium]